MSLIKCGLNSTICSLFIVGILLFGVLPWGDVSASSADSEMNRHEMGTDQYAQTEGEQIAATRTMPSELQPGERFTIEIATNLVNGAIEEKLPLDFFYAGVNEGQCELLAIHRQQTNVIEFVFMGDAGENSCVPQEFSYDVIAASGLRTYTFGGTLTAITSSPPYKIYHTVGGDTEIEVKSTVEIPPDVRAVRTLPVDPMAPLDQFQVSIHCSGIGLGGVTETLPAGFAYVDESASANIDEVTEDGDNVIFVWTTAPGTFTYELIASGTPGDYLFAGIAKGEREVSGTEEIIEVAGDSVVTLGGSIVEPFAVTTNDATNIGEHSVKLHGTLNSMGSAASVAVSFQWGITNAYGNERSAGNMTGTGSFSADLNSLADDTTYHCRTKAVGDTTVYGADRTFTTDDSGDVPPPTYFSLTTEANPSNGGIVLLNPPGGSYAMGTSVIITAEATNGYEFKSWSGGIDGSDNPANVFMNADVIVTASYELIASGTQAQSTPTPAPTPTPTPTLTETPTPTPTPTPTLTETPTPNPIQTETPRSSNGNKAKPTRIIDPIKLDTGESSDEQNGGGGVNVGLVIGLIVGVLLISLAGFYFWRMRQPIEF